MSAYYYLVASLPDLMVEKPPGLTMSQFLERCSHHLSPPDYLVLEQVGLFQKDPHPVPLPVLDRWYQQEHALRNEWVRLRAQKLGRDPKASLRPAPPDAEAAHIARDLMALPPWEMEQRLLEIRWHRLEALEVGHYFDLEQLVVYLLKLRLLERKNQFDTDRGRRHIDRYQDEVGDLTRQSLAANLA